jgi:RNA polymerase sigma factor (sigma-70 family)
MKLWDFIVAIYSDQDLMKTKIDVKRIIKMAASGDSKCQEQLVRLVTPKLRMYIFRNTLDKDITEDLLQEVYCKMLGSLGTLRNATSFWAWLYRIASNCINSHYRTKSKHSRVANFQDELLESAVKDDKSAEASLMNKELGLAVMEAVAKLKPKHRQVVNLRCFESMSFKEIAQIEQTREVYARILFHRAMEKLRIALKKQGFQKASLVLALTMFGRLTATSKAAAIATTVKASTVTGVGAAAKVGIATKIVKTVSTVSVHQIKVAMVTAATATIVTTTATIGPFCSDVTSAHYVIQGVMPVVEQTTNTTQVKKRPSSSSSSSSFSSSIISDRAHVRYQTKGAYENKLYMPQGTEGPVMRFMQRWNTEQTGKLCSWLQDGSGNYYYYSGEDKIYITNDPLRMLILPTDSPDLVKFIFSQIGYDSRLSYERKFLTGLMKYSVDNRVPDYPDYKCKYAYNSLELSDLSSAWPKTDNIEDMRDQMHKRGWTYFEIAGYINNSKITGTGRIPFIYDMYQDNLPWMTLRVGNEVYIDYPGSIAEANTEEDFFLFRNEAFFEGFCRPWEGLPCIDSVRRDAAKYRLRFTTEDQDNQTIVTVLVNTGGTQTAMVYNIDKDVDVIRSIQFKKGDKVFGELYFDYMQDISTADIKKFQEPQTEILPENESPPDMLWLSMLAS